LRGSWRRVRRTRGVEEEENEQNDGDIVVVSRAVDSMSDQGKGKLAI